MSLLAMVWLLAGTPAAGAQAEPDPEAEPEHPVKAELLLDRGSVSPGQQLGVGVRLQIEDGWHVYWRYPGTSGLATEVTGKEPADWSWGELRFPAPHRFVQPGSIEGFGYQDEVVLELPVGVPKKTSTGDVEIVVDADWLVCKDRCIPGSAHLEESVTVVLPRQNAEASLKSWRAQQPVPAKSAGVRVETSGSVSAGQCQVILRWSHRAPADLEWFPVIPSSVSIHDVAIENHGKRSEISFQVRVLYGQTLTDDAMDSVAAWGSGADRRGIRFSVPLK